MRIKIVSKVLVLFDLVDMNKFVLGLQSDSFVSDGKNCVFLDYDDLPEKEIKKDIMRLQDIFDLPDFYVYRSSLHEGVAKYNAFCFTPLDYETWSKVLWESKADFNFKKISTANKKATLRFTPKKEKPDSIPILAFMCANNSKRKEIKNGVFILNRLLNIERDLHGKTSNA